MRRLELMAMPTDLDGMDGMIMLYTTARSLFVYTILKPHSRGVLDEKFHNISLVPCHVFPFNAIFHA